MLISLVVRYGGMFMDIHDETATDDTEIQKISVAEYIYNDLVNDGLNLRNKLYQSILLEAVAHAKEEGWVSLDYFMAHPDENISKLASDVGLDNFELSKLQREQYVEDKDRLDEVVPRILHDYKHSLIKEHLKQLLTELRNPMLKDNPQKAEELMKQYMEMSQIERAFAKVLGDRVVLKYGNK